MFTIYSKQYLAVGLLFTFISLAIMTISGYTYYRVIDRDYSDIITKIQKESDIKKVKELLIVSVKYQKDGEPLWSKLFFLSGLTLLFSSIFLLNVYLSLNKYPNKAVK